MGIVKGIGKAIKSVVSGVKTVFKKVTSSTIGKVVLAAAAIYFTGGAFGAWNTGFASVDGAFVGGAGAAGGAGGTAGTLAGAADTTAAAGAGAAGTAEAAAGSGAIANAAANGIETITVHGAAPSLASTIVPHAVEAGTAAAATMPAESVSPASMASPTKLASTSAGRVAPSMVDVGTAPGMNMETGGLISKLMKPVSNMASSMFNAAEAHPTLALAALSGVGGALSPDAIDLEQERQKQHQQDLQRWNDNMQVGNIDLGFKATRQPLQYTNGQPVYNPITGAINSQRRT